MKIGIMLRHLNQHGGGVKNYTENLLNNLLSINTSHEFVLIYNDPKFIGTYNKYKNVREIAVKIKSRFLWDQIGIPWINIKEKFDLIFNPKYSLPLFVKCPTVFVCHGLDWYVMPWGSKWFDNLNHKYLFPRFVSKADSIIAVSNTAKQHLIDFLSVEPEKVKTVYLGIHESFRKEIEKDELKKIKLEYKLPERFFLYAGQIYPPKNFGRLLDAYAKVGPQLSIHLVIAGEHRWLCKNELEMIERLGISNWVKRPGWIKHETLRYFYPLAEALILPSLYEACPSPILEALAKGCPILTSDRFGTKELAGNAAVLVNPENVENIIEGMRKIVTDKTLRQEIIQNGYSIEKDFSWGKCAEETLEVFEQSVASPIRKRSRAKLVKLPNRFVAKPPADLFPLRYGRKFLLWICGTFLFLFAAYLALNFGAGRIDLSSIKISLETNCAACYNFALKTYKNFVGNEFKTYYFYIFIAVVFLGEFILPVRKSQKRFSLGFYHDFVWFLVNIFFFSVLISFYWIFLRGAYSNYFSFLRVDFVSHLPIAVQIVTVILIGDFLGWFHHYVRHKVPLFWYFHSIHHSQKEMNIFTDYRVHFVEYIIAFTIRFIPILSLTQSVIYPTALGWILFNRWHTRFYHANLKTNYGLLRYILVTPQSHRIHHSTEREHYDKNFGVLFSFWDRLFRTQYNNYDEYPETTGINEKTFPHEREIKFTSLIYTPIRQMIYPFRMIITNLNKTGKLFKW